MWGRLNPYGLCTDILHNALAGMLGKDNPLLDVSPNQCAGYYDDSFL
jgi:hypothetical protein